MATEYWKEGWQNTGQKVCKIYWKGGKPILKEDRCVCDGSRTALVSDGMANVVDVVYVNMYSIRQKKRAFFEPRRVPDDFRSVLKLCS
jgi:hypothetical protein